MATRPTIAILAGIVAAVAHAATAVPRGQHMHIPVFLALRDLGWSAPWIVMALTIVDLVIIALLCAFVIRLATSLNWLQAFALFAAGHLVGYLAYDLFALGPDLPATLVRLWSIFPPMLAALVVSALVFCIVLRKRAQRVA
jgi:hypothetical protein